MFAILLLWGLGACQLPLLIWLGYHGLPTWLLGGWFVLANAQIVIRVRMLPRPEPPPVWFERHVIGLYFAYGATCLWFVPGVIAWHLLDLGPLWGWAWVVSSVVLGAIACGTPWRHVVVRRYPVEVDGLPADLEGTTIALVSDLHAGPFAREERITGWVARVNRLNPDWVVLCGDLIASGTDWIPELERALATLRPKRRTLAVMGNHDYFGDAGEAIIEMHERLGHTFLQNSSVSVDGLSFAGVDDTWRRLDDLDAALEACGDQPVVLLAHDPETFEEAAARGVALQLSGHVHGGQLAIPFLGRAGSVLQPFGQRWIQGRYELERSTLILSAGIGTTGAPVRVGMPSEICLVSLSRRPQ